MEQQRLADLEELFDQLERVEEVTPEQLDALRRELPTEATLAMVVEKALPFPWSEVFEYVSASEHQSAYWRTKPDRTVIRSEADRRHRERFSAAAKASRGVTGTVTRDGQEIPKSAASVAETVETDEEVDSKQDGTGDRALDRLLTVLRR